MIETLLILLIKELGPVGVLVVGIFWIQYRATKKICNSLHQINHKITEVNHTLQMLGALLECKFNSEKNPD